MFDAFLYIFWVQQKNIWKLGSICLKQNSKLKMRRKKKIWKAWNINIFRIREHFCCGYTSGCILPLIIQMMMTVFSIIRKKESRSWYSCVHSCHKQNDLSKNTKVEMGEEEDVHSSLTTCASREWYVYFC